MQRLAQVFFVVYLVALCWFAMMAVHEFGHAVGALLTGGSIRRIVLHPLTISRTDLSANPHPGVVVWLGPIVGSLLPVIGLLLVPRRFVMARNIASFFAGFCLVANGAYISFGALDRVGDCREIFLTGTPVWAMWAFGAAAIPVGLLIWHRIGSVSTFINNPSLVRPRLTLFVFLSLVAVLIAEFVLSPK
jgi:hypothetical protein